MFEPMKNKMVSIRIIFVLCMTISLMLIGNAYAISPSFPEQKIHSGAIYFPEDGSFDQYSEALVLEGAFYKSHGESFDARLIIHGKSGFDINNTLSYGMLIDSDSDFNTGKKGFDYRYYVKWDNGTWYEIYEEIPTGSVNPIKEFEKNHIESPFIEDSVEHSGIKQTVEMSMDLSKIGNPDLYAVAFYTEGTIYERTPLIQYVTSLAVIPPPEFVVSTNPPLISFESSTEEIVNIIVESDIAETTDVYHNIYSDNKNLEIAELLEDNSIHIRSGKAEIPIKLKDVAHDDIQVHHLSVDLNPWHAVNPETRNAERGGEIFESYHYRNHQEAQTFLLSWISLPAPSYDWQLSIQIAILIATGMMVVFAFFTYEKQAKMTNYTLNEKHKHEILDVYDKMQSLLYEKRGFTKEFVLTYPENDDKRIEASVGSVNLHASRIFETVEFNGANVFFYHSALEHLKSYPEINEKWNSLYESISNYNAELISLKKSIEEHYLEFFKKHFTNFVPADGTSKHVFNMESIVRESYEILDDAMNGRDVDLDLEETHHMLSDEYEHIESGSENDEAQNSLYKNNSLLLFSTEPFPNEAHNMLNTVLTGTLKKKYQSLMKIEQKNIKFLDEFRFSIKDVVKELTLGVKLKGECKLERERSFKITRFFSKLFQIGN